LKVIRLKILEKLRNNTVRARLYPFLGPAVWSCWFDSDVRINHPSHISLGKDCMFFRNVTIDAFGEQRFNIELGREVRIREDCYIDAHGGWITIGDNVFIGPQCMIYGQGGLDIGCNTLIAGKTTIIPANHNFLRTDIPIRSQGEVCKGIRIEDNVWIGAAVIVLDGVHIGSNTIIGAGSIVTRSIPPYSLAMGSPARVTKKR
jgi:acetyltransferase-like isoleucine patch superfamily enzyme